MPLGQGFLNAWVKTNSKHIVIPPTNKIHHHHTKDELNNSRSKANRAAGSVTTTRTVTTNEDADTQAIRRFNNRKNRRRLHRTVSASDLLRDKSSSSSKGGGEKNIDSSTSTATATITNEKSASNSSSNNKSVTGAAATTTETGRLVKESRQRHHHHHCQQQSKHSSESKSSPSEARRLPQHHEDRSVVSIETEGSLRFVAGFFGANIEPLEQQGSGSSSNNNNNTSQQQQQIQQQQTFTKDGVVYDYQSNNDSYDAASVQLTGPYTQLDAGSIQSRGGHSLPGLTTAKASPKKYHHQNKHRPSNNDSSPSSSRGGGGGIGIRFLPFAATGGGIGDNSNSKGGGRSCRQCSKLENELLSAREDLEYLRGAALRNEYTCSTCKRESKNDNLSSQGEKSTSSSNNNNDNNNMSQTLNEVISRHKIQIDRLKKESASMQQEMHGKFQKYSTLCKDLNEEAEFRNEEALNLHNELNAVRLQRDQMATELEELHARIRHYERNDQERKKSELILQQYEQRGLDGVDRAIRCRDVIIQDLEARLERALNCLDLERQQQRQRRQIIFPSQRPSHYVQGGGRFDNDELEEELRSTKDSLRDCQNTVEALKRENQKKEVEWMVRIEQLERQLEAAR